MQFFSPREGCWLARCVDGEKKNNGILEAICVRLQFGRADSLAARLQMYVADSKRAGFRSQVFRTPAFAWARTRFSFLKLGGAQGPDLSTARVNRSRLP